MGDPSTVRTFCRLCEVGCGLTASVEDGILLELRPDHDHPTTRGFACSKGLRGRALHADTDRLQTPQRRGDEGFVEVTWDAALTEIGERLRTLIAEHGPRSVGLYLGNPNAFNALGSATAVMFPAMLGSDRLFSASTQDCSNKYAVSELVYGTPFANPVPDLARTELLLLVGSNPRVSGSSFMSVADPVAHLRAIPYLRVMFSVDDIDDTLDRLAKHGAHLVSPDVVEYETAYRLCYVRGPEGILIGLAQELS